jgi:hypothetical protein
MKVRLVGKAGDGEAIVCTWLCVHGVSWCMTYVGPSRRERGKARRLEHEDT